MTGARHPRRAPISVTEIGPEFGSDSATDPQAFFIGQVEIPKSE